ncbi:MAG: hypothetical protein AAGG44_11545 [Planctomycetota bacterium]
MRELTFATTSTLMILAVLCLPGCGGAGQQSTVSVVQPESFEMDGAQWTKVEWTTQIDKKVAKHFRKAADVADNPVLSGDQACYSNGTKQRVFWLNTLDGSCQWAMIEFKGSRGGELVEGTGAPFSQVEAADPS